MEEKKQGGGTKAILKRGRIDREEKNEYRRRDGGMVVDGRKADKE